VTVKAVPTYPILTSGKLKRWNAQKVRLPTAVVGLFSSDKTSAPEIVSYKKKCGEPNSGGSKISKWENEALYIAPSSIAVGVEDLGTEDAEGVRCGDGWERGAPSPGETAPPLRYATAMIVCF